MSEQRDSDATIPYDDTPSFEASKSFQGQQSCDFYPVKVPTLNIVTKNKFARALSKDNSELIQPKKRKSRVSTCKYLRHKRKQATNSSKVP
jgi:hypothetical protein